MKKNLLVASIALLLMGTAALTSCGGTQTSQTNQITITVSGPTSVEVGASIRIVVNITNDAERLGYSLESSDTSIATVTQEGIVTGVGVGTVSITAKSRQDESISQVYTIDVTESTIPSLTITTDLPYMTLSSMGGTAVFKANINNPNNYAVKYTWGAKYDKGTFIGNGGATQEYRPFYAGAEVITLEAQVGPYLLKAEYNFLIKTNYAGWIEISTKDQLIALINNNTGSLSGTMASNYFLGADIDMEGYVVSPSNRNSGADLTGTLDGRGHTISNYYVAGESGNAANGGLFSKIASTGTVRNLAIDCEIAEAGSGWGTGGLAAGNDGLIENCYFKVNHSYDTGLKADANGYVPFCAAITGSTNGITRDVVVEIAATEGAATIYADHAYPTAGQAVNNNQVAKVTNFYTNHSVIGGQAWDWGYPIRDQSGYKISMNFASAEATDYNLNTDLWNLTDGLVPSLKVQA